MKRSNIFKTLARKNDSSSLRRGMKGRLARLEELEARQLLAVTAVEYAAIVSAYPEFELPASMEDIHVIEIAATNLTVADLKGAILEASAASGDDLIVVRTTADANSIVFSSASDEILVNLNSQAFGQITLVAFGESPLTLDAASWSRVLSVAEGSVFNLGHCRLTGGRSALSVSQSGYGGGIHNAGTLTISDCSVSENVSSYGGGGIFNSGHIRATDCRIADNAATAYYYAYGGGIYNSGTVTAENILIAENKAEGIASCGGGVYNWTGRFEAVGATMTGNSAVYGGGIDVFGSSSSRYAVTFSNSILTGNNATADDGGDDVYRYNAKGTISARYVLSDYAGWNESIRVTPYDPSKPLFTNAAAGNYAPASGSQVIDIGMNDYVTTATDLNGKRRIVDATESGTAVVDLGAYELQSTETPSAVVTTNLDVVDEFDGLISIREAIAYVTAGSVPETRITFRSDVFTGGNANVITLTGGELAVTAFLAIDASALSEKVTLDAGGASRVLSVNAGTEDNPVALLGLNITGGNIAGEKSAGMGGGIYLSGFLSAVCCAVKGNVSASGGGGIYVDAGSFAAVNVAVFANSAVSNAGIYVGNGTFIGTNCSIVGNSAKSNGGGIGNMGSIHLYNSIVSQNYAANNSDWFGFGAAVGSSNNLVGFEGGFTVAPVFDAEGNLTNADQLDLTLTSSSWGIDRGDNSQNRIGVDLAGRPRTVRSWASEATIDIGAYEYQSVVTKNVETPSTTVTTELDVVDDSDGLISLREAIIYAAAGDTIRFSSSLAGKTITLVGGSALNIDKALSIDASDISEGISISGDSKSSVLIISAGSAENPVRLTRVTLTGGRSNNGGGIVNTGATALNDCVITSNSATNGAGIFNFHGEVTVDHSVLSKNVTGGAIYNYMGTVTVKNSTFSENGATRGGGINNAAGTIAVTDSVFSQNSANYGGGIYNSSGEAVLSRTTFEKNVSHYGGGICSDGTIVMTDAVLMGNQATYNGGAVYNFKGSFTAKNVLAFDNSSNYGGAFCVDQGRFDAVNCSIVGNSSASGGGVFCFGVASAGETSNLFAVNLYNTILVGNSATKSGADINRNNEHGSINAYNSLSTYTEWDNASSSVNYVYDANDRLFADPENDDYSLVPGSQAIDRGGNDYVTVETDLAGNDRIVHEIVDLGAYEYQREKETPSVTVTTFRDIVDDSDGLISLREAILYVEAGETDETTILFDPYLKRRTITLDSELGPLCVTKFLTMDASAIRGGVTVSGGGESRVFQITGGTAANPVRLIHLTVTGGKTAENGAGIHNAGTLEMVDCLVTGNEAEQNGGGIWNAGALTVTGSTITANRAASGGGLYAGNLSSLPCVIHLQNTILVGNTLSTGTAAEADVARSTAQGELNAFNTLSTFIEWDNADGQGVDNYLYDSAKPLFTDAAAGKYSLAADSQGIDMGDNDRVPGAVDLAGNKRIVNKLVDLGAFEYQLNADPGDTPETAEPSVFEADSFVYRDMIGNGLYGDKDVDLFVLTITEPELSKFFSFAVTTPEDGTEVASFLRLFNSEGEELGKSGSTPVLAWTPSEAGTYYLGVSSVTNSAYDPKTTENRISGETGDYILTVTRTERTAVASVALSDAALCVASILTAAAVPTDATVHYQWYRGTDPDAMTAIDGAIGDYYEIAKEDIGGYVGVTVTGYGQYIGSASAVSASVVAGGVKSLFVNSIQDIADPNDGLTTLREAIAYADAGETITFAPALNGGTVTLSGYALTIPKIIHVDASNLADGIIVNAGEKSLVFVVTAGILGTNVELTNLTITKGNGFSGGGIYNAGHLSLVDCVVTQNTAYYGGGIFNDGGVTEGAILTRGFVKLQNTVLSNNKATNGGGVWNRFGVFELNGALIKGNSATYGGGIYNYGGAGSSTDSVFTANSGSIGGAICNDQSDFYVINTTVAGNSASLGGGIYNYGYSAEFSSKIELYNSVVVQNTASQSGNDIQNENAFGTVSAYCTLSSFTAWSNGEQEGVVNDVYDPTKPLFTDAAKGDYSLADGSQAIDRGDNYYVDTEVDIAGNLRIVNEIVDLGAYEYQRNADSGDLLETARAVRMTDSGYAYSEGVGNGEYGTKDVDLYALTVTETGGLFTAAVSAPTGSDPFGVVLRLFDSTGTPLDAATGSSGSTVSLTWKPAAAGRYYLGVSGTGNADYNPSILDGRTDGAVGGYVLAVTHTDKIPLESAALAYDSESLDLFTTVTADVVPAAAVEAGNVTYQWFRGESDAAMTAIAGATGKTYSVTTADMGFYLKVTATGTGDYAGVVSAATAEAVPLYVKTGIVTTTADVMDWTDDAMSLREAILLADAGDVITFAETLSGGRITLSAALGQLEITKSLTLDAAALYDSGGKVPGMTIDAAAVSGESRRVLNVVGDSDHPIDVVLTGLTITGGRIESDSSGADGGGIYAVGTSLTLNRCLVEKNRARAYSETSDVFAAGGGIFLAGGTLTVMDSRIAGNALYAASASGYAQTLGGGIRTDGAATIIRSEITGNYASSGGGIYMESGTLSIADSLISKNVVKIESDGADDVTAYGGGIFAADGIVTITGGAITENEVSTTSVSGTADAYGGGIYLDGASIFINDTVLSGNKAVATSTTNTAVALGGGVYSNGALTPTDAALTLTDSLVAGNRAAASGNDAEAGGGGISVIGDMTLVGGTIVDNAAVGTAAGSPTEAGGGVYVFAGIASVRNTIIALNSGADGSDVFRRSSATVNADRTLSGYSAWDNAGAQGGVNYVYDSAKPLFSDREKGDYTLAENSQAIDLGDNANVFYPDGTAIRSDLAGKTRIVNRVVDLGAYEYQTGEPAPLDAPENVATASAGANRVTVTWDAVEGAAEYELAYSTDQASWQTIRASETSFTVTGLTYGVEPVYYRVRAAHDEAVSDWSETVSAIVCPMDVNGDGRINASDRSLISSAWNSRAGSAVWDPRCDVNGDGRVNASDQTWLSSNWSKRSNASDLSYPAERGTVSEAVVPIAQDDEEFDFVNFETCERYGSAGNGADDLEIDWKSDLSDILG